MDELTDIKQQLETMLSNQQVLLDILGIIVLKLTGKIPVVAMEKKDGDNVTYTAPSLKAVVLCPGEPYSSFLNQV